MTKRLVWLISVMVELYPDVDSSRRIMDDVGVDGSRILAEQQPFFRWYAIIDECEKAGLIPALLSTVASEYPRHSDLLQGCSS